MVRDLSIIPKKELHGRFWDWLNPEGLAVSSSRAASTRSEAPWGRRKVAAGLESTAGSSIGGLGFEG